MKSLVASLVLMLIAFVSVAQPYGDANFKKKFNKADALVYDGSFLEALPLLDDLYKYDTLNANLNHLLGICYLRGKKDHNKAIKLLESASRDVAPPDMYQEGNWKERKAPGITYYYLGKAYHYKNRFDRAVSNYYNYRSFISLDDVETYNQVRQQIQYAENAMELVKNPIGVKVTNLGSEINTQYAEYCPVVSADGKVLIFTSRREGGTGGAVDDDGRYYEDIYVCQKQPNGKWSKPKSIGSSINSAGHEAAIGLSPDGQLLFIYKDDNNDGNIYQSKRTADGWSKLEPLGSDINTSAWETHASITATQDFLVFSSNRSEGGLGGRDLWYCRKLPNGEWGLAQNMGSVINTNFEEDSPFITADGKTLIFSSMGHTSMGGFDIFRSEFEDGAWTVPENIGYPINTSEDDVFFVLNPDGRTAYYSSRMDGGYGDTDLYYLRLEVKKASALAVARGVMKVPAMEYANIKARIEVADEAGAMVGTYRPNTQTGYYVLVLDPGETYNISYLADGYEPVTAILPVSDDESYQEYDGVLELDDVVFGENILALQAETAKLEQEKELAAAKAAEEERLAAEAAERAKQEAEEQAIADAQEEERRKAEELAAKEKADAEAALAAEKSNAEQAELERRKAEAQAKFKAQQEEARKKAEAEAAAKATEEEKARLEQELAEKQAAEDRLREEQLAVKKAEEEEVAREAAEAAALEAAQAAEQAKAAEEAVAKKAAEDRLREEQLAAKKAEEERVARQAAEEAEARKIAQAAEQAKAARLEAEQEALAQAKQEEIEQKDNAQEEAKALAQRQAAAEQKRQDLLARIEELKSQQKEQESEVEEVKEVAVQKMETVKQEIAVDTDAIEVKRKAMLARIEQLKKRKVEVEKQKVVDEEAVVEASEKEKEAVVQKDQLVEKADKTKQEIEDLEKELVEVESKVQEAESQVQKARKEVEEAQKKVEEDIAEQKRIEEEERKKKQEAEEAARQIKELEELEQKRLEQERLAAEQMEKEQREEAERTKRELVQLEALAEQQAQVQAALVAEERKKKEIEAAEADAYSQEERLSNATTLAELRKLNEQLIRDNLELKKQLAELNSKLDLILQRLDYQPDAGKVEMESNATMRNLQQGRRLVLRNIFFDYNQATLRSRSKHELNKLYRFMKDHPTVSIEVSGHTDSRGNDDYNMRLSLDRAKAVVNYLVRNGISSTRLTAKGYGETRPIARNENADLTDNAVGRQLNRRIEISLPKGKIEGVEVEEIEVPSGARIK